MAQVPQHLIDYINARVPRNELAPGESQAIDATDSNECFLMLLETMFELLPLVSLDTPESLEAEPGDNEITLTWAIVERATGYVVRRDGIAVYSGIFPLFVDDDVVNGEEHTYEVFATAPGYVTSGAATITTQAGIETTTFTATAYHSATDPFVDTSTDPTPGATLLRSVTPDTGDDIEIQLNDFPFEYFILEYDDTEADVTTFFDTVFHNEAIPGFEFRAPFSVGGKKYVTSYSPSAFDASPATVTFSF